MQYISVESEEQGINNLHLGSPTTFAGFGRYIYCNTFVLDPSVAFHIAIEFHVLAVWRSLHVPERRNIVTLLCLLLRSHLKLQLQLNFIVFL